MELDLDTLLEKLPAQHQHALAWFLKNTDSIQLWPQPLSAETRLATKAKGIYKPAWSKYALSIRQTLGGPYPDRKPEIHPDGSWSYLYFQEGEEPERRDKFFTNRALLECIKDHIPVGVLVQVSVKPNAQYRVLGLAIPIKWENGYFTFRGFGDSKKISAPGEKGAKQTSSLSDLQLQIETQGDFNPVSIEDSREKVLASIVRRRDQAKFRAQLLRVYAGVCAATGCTVEPALEAAHVTPYLGEATNTIRNGILLRSDVHVLWDLGLIWVNEIDGLMYIDETLLGTKYGKLHQSTPHFPSPDLRPSTEALRRHRLFCES